MALILTLFPILFFPVSVDWMDFFCFSDGVFIYSESTRDGLFAFSCDQAVETLNGVFDGIVCKDHTDKNYYLTMGD